MLFQSHFMHINVRIVCFNIALEAHAAAQSHTVTQSHMFIAPRNRRARIQGKKRAHENSERANESQPATSAGAVLQSKTSPAKSEYNEKLESKNERLQRRHMKKRKRKMKRAREAFELKNEMAKCNSLFIRSSLHDTTWTRAEYTRTKLDMASTFAASFKRSKHAS